MKHCDVNGTMDLSLHSQSQATLLLQYVRVIYPNVAFVHTHTALCFNYKHPCLTTAVISMEAQAGRRHGTFLKHGLSCLWYAFMLVVGVMCDNKLLHCKTKPAT